jgi:diguanylate cyclase with GGDEF domain
VATCFGPFPADQLWKTDARTNRLVRPSFVPIPHVAGDELLVAVAERFRRSLRAADTAARLGGDEFAVLIEDAVGEHDAEVVAQHLLDVLKAPFMVARRELYVQASIGIAVASSSATCDQLLREADFAMYAAKRSGKNRFQSFAAGAQNEALDKLELGSSLRRALDGDEISSSTSGSSTWRRERSSVPKYLLVGTTLTEVQSVPPPSSRLPRRPG